MIPNFIVIMQVLHTLFKDEQTLKVPTRCYTTYIYYLATFIQTKTTK